VFGFKDGYERVKLNRFERKKRWSWNCLE